MSGQQKTSCLCCGKVGTPKSWWHDNPQAYVCEECCKLPERFANPPKAGEMWHLVACLESACKERDAAQAELATAHAENTHQLQTASACRDNMNRINLQLLQAQDEYGQIAGLLFGESEWEHDDVYARLVKLMNDYATAQADNRRLREALEDGVSAMSLVSQMWCGNFHHSKKDRHDYDKPCPVVARWDDALKQARAALAGGEK